VTERSATTVERVISHRKVELLMLGVLGVAAVSFATTGDRVNWILEEVVVLVAVPVVWWFSARHEITGVLAVAAVLQMLVITHGAHTTYEHAQLGEWLGSTLGISRNPWDRVGHLFQGIVPALAAREVLRRHAGLQAGPLVAFLSISVAMCIAALYEIIEMILGLIGSEATRDFVDTNGDLLDPQWDMTMALIGSLVAVVVLARWQERQLAKPAL